ncbi:MAG: hypothetical protein M0P72_01555 [Metallibacterium scheffleri]|jgi:hypothetical protein|uniref:hypothetical protein n=1 Tax=Metallibacterium scheffleri TaxID=993689 RepID=UPI0026F2E91C|nr:hypothetical protein [Metallibacterium scheffleri]MCK9365823.1 hypothetical protein [Metallibacterium scheffleri]
MSEAYTRLIAGMPARVPAAGGIPASARRMQQNIAQLPMANPAVAARELTHLLARMLTTVWPGGERLAALDGLGASVAQLSDGFERQLANESFPLPAAKLALAEIVSGFQRALADGYVLAVYELCAPAGKVGWMRSQVIAQGLARALRHGGLSLLWHYRLYRTPPAGAWLRMHAAYAFALESGIADKPVTLDPAQRLSPSTIYKHALLLALSNPYRFSARELSDAYEITGVFAARCRLHAGGSGAIALDLAADTGPGYLPEERRAAAPGLHDFDAEPARAALAADRQMQPGGIAHGTYRLHDDKTLEVSHAFLERLQSTWSGNAERGHARLQAGHPLEAVIGLHALHMLLAGGQQFQTFLSGLRGAGISIGAHTQSPAWAAPADGGGVAVQRVQVLDQSLGGYRLLWHAETGMRIRVGEIVGLAPPAERGDTQDWMVGVVRWLRIEESGQLDTGVELLARQTLPAAVRFPDARGQLRNAVRALLLHGDDHEQLLLATLNDAIPAALELSLPEDPRDWQPLPSVRLAQIESSAALSPGYQSLRVSAAPRPMPASAAAGADA